MRAVQIRTFGEPGIVLELADHPEPPAPAAGQVLIGVEHAPINMNDLDLIQGVYPVRPSLPRVVGNEGVGRVLAIGRGVDKKQTLRGFWLLFWYQSAAPDDITAMFEHLAPLIVAGTVSTPVGATYGFDQVRDAITRAAQSGGKVLFTP